MTLSRAPGPTKAVTSEETHGTRDRGAGTENFPDGLMSVNVPGEVGISASRPAPSFLLFFPRKRLIGTFTNCNFTRGLGGAVRTFALECPVLLRSARGDLPLPGPTTFAFSPLDAPPPCSLLPLKPPGQA